MGNCRKPGLRSDKKEQSRRAPGGRKGAEGSTYHHFAGGSPAKSGKKRPRGHPWPQGVSGNPQGRPKGARNHFSLAVAEGARRAAEELAKSKMLDRGKPYECWDGYLIQEGLRYDWNTEELLPGQEPAPNPPTRFDPGQRRTEMTWMGRPIYVQNGWPFNPRTWRRLKL